jgi:hypothetical protein
MKKRAHRAPSPLPVMMAELAFDSWSTMLRRTQLILAGKCGPSEYQQMVLEKAEAAQASAAALFRVGPPDLAAIVSPWHQRAKANARRLRQG